MNTQPKFTFFGKMVRVLFIPVVVLLLSAVQLQAETMQGERETAVATQDLLCRFGVNALEDPVLTNLTDLRVGWYMNFTAKAAPSQPGGMEYMQTIRLKPNVASPGYTITPNKTTINSIITQNPGVKWLIANEPDSPLQDNLTPPVYARAYDDLYHYIKNQDPTAQVIIGSIIQATPVRLLYLDMILTSYYEQFNTSLATDGWSIHNYILNECNFSTVSNCWGAGIPPGINWNYGEVWGIKDNDRVDVFIDRIVRFRQWLANRGYAGQPVYLTEFGVQMPSTYLDEEGNAFPPSRVNAFMDSTFDYMLAATDSKLGDPNDGYKLVQQWAWFSSTPVGFNGELFFSNYTPTEMGTYYDTYTSSLSNQVDFYPSLITTALPVPFSSGAPVNVTLRTVIANSGNLTNQTAATVQFYDGDPAAGGSQIGLTQNVNLSGCGDNQEVSVVWNNVPPGTHQIYVKVTPGVGVIETNSANNLGSDTILVASHRLFLPTVNRPLPVVTQ